jgi:hypothetical protein
VALAVVVNNDPSASTVRHEAGSYCVLSLFLVPMLAFAARHSLHALGIRASIQNAAEHPSLHARTKLARQCQTSAPHRLASSGFVLVRQFCTIALPLCAPRRLFGPNVSVGSLAYPSQRLVVPKQQSLRTHRRIPTWSTWTQRTAIQIAGSASSQRYCLRPKICAIPTCTVSSQVLGPCKRTSDVKRRALITEKKY